MPAALQGTVAPVSRLETTSASPTPGFEPTIAPLAVQILVEHEESWESRESHVQIPPPLRMGRDDEPPQPVRATAEPLAPRIKRYARACGGWVAGRIAARSRELAAAAAVLVVVSGLGWGARFYGRHRALAPRTGTVVLQSLPAGSDVSIDGLPAGKTPTSREVPPGRHVVAFRRRNATRTVNVEVAAGGSALSRLDWSATRMGRLQVASYPSGATVNVDGRDIGVTPLTVDEVAEGSHAVVLKSASGSVRRTVAIIAGQTVELSETIYAGWLAISSPIELAISERGRALQVDDRNQIRLTPGSHEVQLENRALGYHEVRRVDVTPGELARLSIVPPPSSITVTATLPSTVVIDEERVGDTPVTSRPVNLGTHEVIVKAVSGVERRFTIAVTTAPARLDVDFSRP